jgi:membrane protein
MVAKNTSSSDASSAAASEVAEENISFGRGPVAFLREAYLLGKQAGADWLEDHATRLAAALAFYTMLSIAPLLVISIKVVGRVFGDDAARNQIKIYATQLMGATAGDALYHMIGPIAQPGAGIVATLISIGVLFFSASGVFGELQDSLNTVWEVKPKPGRPWWRIFRERFLSFVLVLGTSFLLLVSLVVNTALVAITRSISGQQQGGVLNVVNFLISIVVITVLFAMIFKYLPDVKIKWRHVWFGAITTGVLFTIGKLLLGWYLGRASTTSVYGAAGSLVAMLLWVYYSAQILFFGAELTQARTRWDGSRVKPTENAVRVTHEERAQQGMPSPERVEAAVKMKAAKEGDGEADVAATSDSHLP